MEVQTTEKFSGKDCVEEAKAFVTESLGHLRISYNQNYAEQRVCGICLESIEFPAQRHGAPIDIGRCGHMYCSGCIRTIVDTTRICPMCKSTLDKVCRVVWSISSEEQRQVVKVHVLAPKSTSPFGTSVSQGGGAHVRSQHNAAVRDIRQRLPLDTLPNRRGRGRRLSERQSAFRRVIGKVKACESRIRVLERQIATAVRDSADAQARFERYRRDRETAEAELDEHTAEFEALYAVHHAAIPSTTSS